jgi:hypothetical protein
MKTAMLKRVRRLFACDLAPNHTKRHNIRAWVHSVRLLGDKWLLAKPVEMK